jgi:transposase InsO family protein
MDSQTCAAPAETNKPTTPLELVQVDTLSVNVRPRRPLTAAKAFSTAGAGCAKNFLDKLVSAFPFAIKGRLDSGSEFMTEFEQACQANGLACSHPNAPTSMVPSSAHKPHGATHDLPHRLDRLNRHIDAFAHVYNHYRPHGVALTGCSAVSPSASAWRQGT